MDTKHTNGQQVWISKTLWQQIKEKALRDRRTIRATIESFIERGMRS